MLFRTGIVIGVLLKLLAFRQSNSHRFELEKNILLQIREDTDLDFVANQLQQFEENNKILLNNMLAILFSIIIGSYSLSQLSFEVTILVCYVTYIMIIAGNIFSVFLTCVLRDIEEGATDDTL